MSRVLVVERVTSVGEALELVLELEGHDVALAATGAGALARVEAWRPDVVLVDADLSDMPLASFCATLRSADPSTLLVVTSMRSAGCTSVNACPGAGFLGKPFTSAELLSVVGCN